jgi:hypothetical protein
MIPGAMATVTLKRRGLSSQAADGTPITTDETIWIKKCHYQSLREDGSRDFANPTGMTSRQVYRFWTPYLEGRDKPILNDRLETDGLEFRVIAVDFEAIRHHLLLRAERVDR